MGGASHTCIMPALQGMVSHPIPPLLADRHTIGVCVSASGKSLLAPLMLKDGVMTHHIPRLHTPGLVRISVQEQLQNVM